MTWLIEHWMTLLFGIVAFGCGQALGWWQRRKLRRQIKSLENAEYGVPTLLVLSEVVRYFRRKRGELEAATPDETG